MSRSPTSTVRIALVGDRSPEVKAHTAIPQALALAAGAVGTEISTEWIPTQELSEGEVAKLGGFQGIWCVPGSPYVSMEGALRAIHYARKRNVAFLGTCGGFQHTLIEYCRSELALAKADHAESNPSASFALITPLSCPLRETAARIHLRPGSRAAAIYGQPETIETFNCGYGLNPEHQTLFSNGAMRISGVADDGSIRIVELPEHAFFLAALFQPERSAERNLSHPLIVAFTHAALAA